MKKIVAGLWVLALGVSSAWSATTLNLKDADILTLITAVSEITGKNFIVDERVKGKVTVVSSRPMSSEAVYETFLAVLQIKGLAAVPAGDTIKIVQESNVRQEGGAALSSGAGRPDDDVVTYVYQIENVSAAQLVPILRPLVPQWGHLAAYGPSNMLIISDRAANVVRLEKLIQQIDRSGDREIELVRLVHAGATDVVRILTTLVQSDKGPEAAAKPATIIADERSNSVLIGGDKSERQKLLDIVSQLDVPLSEDGATQVVYLRYASAENLAPILEGYVQKPGGTPAATPGAAPGDGAARILADKDTNALVITASPKAMRALKAVIAQLDIKRSQVLVEAVIAEVSAAKSSQLGVDWAIFNDNRIVSGSILDSATLALAAATTDAEAALALGANGAPGLVLGGGSDNSPGGTSFAILLKALQGDGDTNVLSTPSVVATDNEESKISVGQEVPFLTGSFTSTGTSTSGTVNPFQTVERKDVGLTLGLTPQISEGNNIKLKLSLEVSNLSSSTTALDLITNKRTLTTTVTVESGQILVLGGLIDDQVTDTQNAVPFLSSIPFLGSLFKFRSVTKDKRNLMVFIRPAILREAAEVDYYTRRKYESLRESQTELASKTKPSLLPGTLRQPVLPDYDEYRQSQPPPSAVTSASPPETTTPSPLAVPETPPLSEAAPRSPLPSETPPEAAPQPVPTDVQDTPPPP
ncbi:MAG: type II secretion system secretin GspD [Nevskiales bacterium]|nr:type II secretion system secretin GspD [Nevskiales bacterium]